VGAEEGCRKVVKDQGSCDEVGANAGKDVVSKATKKEYIAK
jgi:hypothetical protein